MRRNRAVDVVVAIVAVGLIAASFAPWETFVSMSSEQRFSTEQLHMLGVRPAYTPLVVAMVSALAWLLSTKRLLRALAALSAAVAVVWIASVVWTTGGYAGSANAGWTLYAPLSGTSSSGGGALTVLDAAPRFGMYAALVASVALAAVMLVSLGISGRGPRATGTAAAPT